MNSGVILKSSYDYWLVALSIALAMFASYAALDLAGRVTLAQGRARAIWLGAGSFAMGLGIWSMHYVGMLALSMPMPVSYHLPTVLLSLFAAILASAIALFVVSRPTMERWQETLGAVAMGGGIAAMHYVGMAAMRLAAVIVYDHRIVALSVALAVMISLIALHLAFRVREEKVLSSRKIISALVMGSAIPLMHYTGMWAATFRPSTFAPDLTRSISISMIGLGSISVSTLVVLGAVIASSFFDRQLALQKSAVDTARERELYFHTMAEAIPEIIWTADPSGADDFFNQKCFEYTGLTFEQMQGSRWKEVVHPDDLQAAFERWENALRSGASYEMEYRLRGKDGIFRWFLGRANPIRDAQGKIVKWFGTCTDIESNKKNEQVLEQQILERTLQLAASNERLQEEMAGKDIARRKFDEQNESIMIELKKRSDRATMLAKMGELLQSCVSREEVIAAALGFAPKIFPAARGAVVLLNSSRNLAEVTGSWGECQLPKLEFESPECWALRTGHPHLVEAGDTTARCAHAGCVECSYLCVPILAQGETLGVLHFQMAADEPLPEAVGMSFKTTFAGQVGLSMANIKLRDALRVQSVRDALTGLYNRRYLEETLERELRRSARAKQTLGILMIDLDHFKKFNDSFGHDAGDAVLRETAVSLTKGVRAEDFVCRFGGEEFVVILPTADLEASLMRAERLRLKVRELSIVHQGKSMGMITISVGVGAFPAHGTSSKELMAAADAALYEAKHRGRDQVVAASPAAPEQEQASGTVTAAWS
jgi:diguanylate cyclase (GGDEF)-like protein/PAS domain S-box-containing protein